MKINFKELPVREDTDNWFHTFIFRAFEASSTASPTTLLEEFIKSKYYTYSSDHSKHCAGPFDNKVLTMDNFTTIPKENIYEDIDTFFIDFFNNFDKLFREERSVLENKKAIEVDKKRINATVKTSKKVINNELLDCADSLYTISYYQQLPNREYIFSGNKLSKKHCMLEAGVYEYYKIYISIKGQQIKVFYFLWD